MKKLLFAINHKQTEAAIEKEIKRAYEIVGIVQYKEAIELQLEISGADTLLVRDSLSGSEDFMTLMRSIRENFPLVRIICIVNERGRGKMLASLVSLGIYDIINLDPPTIPDIASCILTPRTFRDVAQYYNGVPEEFIPKDISTNSNHRKKKATPFKIQSKREPDVATHDTAPVPQAEINVESMRLALEEEANRKAKLKMDAVTKEAIKKETEEIQQRLKDKETALSDMKLSLGQKEKLYMQELKKSSSIQTELANLQRELEDTKELLKQTISEKETEILNLKNASKELSPDIQNNLDSLRLAQNSYEKTIKDKESIAAQKIKENKDLQLHIKALQGELSDTQKKANLAIEEKEVEISNIKLLIEQRDETIKQELSKQEKLRLEYVDKIKNLENELETKTKTATKVDLSGDSSMSMAMLDDPNRIDEAIPSKNRVFMFMGSKHGVGNSTVALNTAVALATRGHKTMFIEFNSSYPMVSEFFELIDIKAGIDTAMSSLGEGKFSGVDSAIIKPYSLISKKPQLMNAYRQLPSALHFMFYTNAFLLKRAQFYDNNYLHQLFDYLLNELKYSYIIIDAQPDDETGRFLLMNSDKFIDRLILTCTQDIHSITTCGMLVNSLTNTEQKDTLKRMRIAVNMFSGNCGLDIVNISKWLSFPVKKFYKISEDRPGYLDAGHNAIPYILNRGQYTKEYSTLALVF